MYYAKRKKENNVQKCNIKLTILIASYIKTKEKQTT